MSQNDLVLSHSASTDGRGSDSLFFPFGAQVGDEIIEGGKKTKEMILETPLTIFGREYGALIVSDFYWWFCSPYFSYTLFNK